MVCRAKKLTGRIGTLGREAEGGCSHDGGDCDARNCYALATIILKIVRVEYLQASQRENQHKSPLLVDGQFACPDRLHWQTQDQDVCGDGVAGIGVPVLRQTDTCWLHALVPRTFDRTTLPDRRGNCPNHVRNKEAQKDIATDSEPSLKKDA